MSDHNRTSADRLQGKSHLGGKWRKAIAIAAAVLVTTVAIGMRLFYEHPGAEAGFLVATTIALVVAVAVAGRFTRRDSASGYGGKEEDPPPTTSELLGLLKNEKDGTSGDER